MISAEHSTNRWQKLRHQKKSWHGIVLNTVKKNLSRPESARENLSGSYPYCT